MTNNPFTNLDSDREEIWEMLVSRDIEAFVNQDWSLIKEDFYEEEFMGINAKKNASVDQWELTFPTLDAYKNEWLTQAESFKRIEWAENISDALHRVTILQDIEINGDAALINKKFVGYIKKRDDTYEDTNWQTIYRCRKINEQWKIVGFTGYIPFPVVKNQTHYGSGKSLPQNTDQHVTAGPYSPVLVVNPGQFVVISGQAAIDKEGRVIGDTIEEQTEYTLANCKIQLAAAGCTLDDVFKVNVYLIDLNEWPKFNEVYKRHFMDPKPVRTAVQTGLLMNLRVEIELWATKNN